LAFQPAVFVGVLESFEGAVCATGRAAGRLWVIRVMTANLLESLCERALGLHTITLNAIDERLEGLALERLLRGFLLLTMLADAVKKYLVGKGIDAARLRPMGFGAEKPSQPNDTPAGRDANRRVEFNIVSE
jgi:hypothetical protein